jgi:HEPN domain-containing protein
LNGDGPHPPRDCPKRNERFSSSRNRGKIRKNNDREIRKAANFGTTTCVFSNGKLRVVNCVSKPCPKQEPFNVWEEIVDESKRNLIGGWLDKASNHLTSAREYLNSYRISEAIQAAQVCVELSVKSILTILEINFPLSHGWNEKQLGQIAEQIEKRQLLTRLKEQYLNNIRLPRLLILVNFWEQFYIQAKYGIEAGNLAPAKDLFEKPEAELAIAHAEECWFQANVLRSTGDEQLAAILP